MSIGVLSFTDAIYMYIYIYVCVCVSAADIINWL